MSKILLDYVFPISVISPTPQASTAFLKQVCLICEPKSGQEGNVGQIFSCNSMTDVAVRTDNTNASQFFSAGMSKVFILLSDDLNVSAALAANASEFFTVIASDDFNADDVLGAKASATATITNYADLVSGTADVIHVGATAFTAQSGAVTPGDATFQAATSNDATAASLAAQINAHPTAGALVTAVALAAVVTLTAKARGVGGNSIVLTYTDNDTNVGATVTGSGHLVNGAALSLALGDFEGVFSFATDDEAAAAAQAAMENHAAFLTTVSNGGKNMCFAFGSLLANASDWLNQQFITMPVDDSVDTLGQANTLFDDRVSFVIHDDEFSNRLALLAAGGKAIVAPYILKNLRVDSQSRALSWISANQPDYTTKEAALLETRIQEDVINAYIARGWISAGTIAIDLENDNFVASGAINVSEPKALWRVVSEMRQTL